MSSLTIDLDDEASDGLDAINARLDVMTRQSMETAKGVEKLSASQRQQITIINNQKSAWSEFGQASVKSLAQVTTVGVKCFSDIARESIKAEVTLNTFLVKEGTSLIKWAIGAGTAIAGLNIVYGSHRKAVKDAADETERHGRLLGMLGNYSKIATLGLVGTSAAIAEQKAGWGLLEKASGLAMKRTIGYVTGLGPQIIGATIALKAHDLAMQATGKTIDVLAAKPLASQTRQQAEAFVRLREEAARNGQTLDNYAKSLGLTSDAMRTLYGMDAKEYASNAERIQEQTKKMSSAVGSDFRSMMNVTKEFFNISAQLPDLGIWKEFDESATRGAKIQAENVEILTDKYQDLMTWVGRYIDSIGNDKPQRGHEAAKLDYQRDADNAKLEAQREKERASFEMLASVREDRAKKDEQRAAQEHINSLKKQSDIDAEIHKINERAGALAREGKFDAEAKKKMMSELDALDKRRKEIDREEAESAKQKALAKQKAHEEERKRSDERYKLFTQEIKQIKELNDTEQKRITQRRQLVADLKNDAATKKAENDLDLAKQMLDVEKQRVAEKMRMGVKPEDQAKVDRQVKTVHANMDRDYAKQVHEQRMKQIADEGRARLLELEKQKREQTGTAQERALAEQKRLAEVDKLEFDLRKKRIDEAARYQREMNGIDVDEYRAREDEKAAITKQRMEKERAMANAHFDPQSAMQAADPQKVLKRIQEERIANAKRQQAEKDRALGERAASGDQAAQRRYQANQKSAEGRAKRGLMMDFENGNIGGGEIQRGQARVAAETVATMAKQGKLNQDQARAMIDMLKTIHDQQMAIDQMAATQKQIVAKLKGVKQAANDSAQNAKSQIGSSQF